MDVPLHPRLRSLATLAEGVEIAARELARVARKRKDPREPRSRRGGTLRPSAQTPLWNAIVVMVKSQLKHRGDRANLARELGVHRARIGEYFDCQSAMPDAERALQLLVWVSRKNQDADTRTGNARARRRPPAAGS